MCIDKCSKVQKNMYKCVQMYNAEQIWEISSGRAVFAGRLQQHMRRCRFRSYNACEDDNDHLLRPNLDSETITNVHNNDWNFLSIDFVDPPPYPPQNPIKLLPEVLCLGALSGPYLCLWTSICVYFCISDNCSNICGVITMFALVFVN